MNVDNQMCVIRVCIDYLTKKKNSGERVNNGSRGYITFIVVNTSHSVLAIYIALNPIESVITFHESTWDMVKCLAISHAEE